MATETSPAGTLRRNFWLRVATLGVIALVALGNAFEWVDPDLWIPFVCIIAVMGLGTRGGVLDTLAFVLVELCVVLVLGVATFSGSRDFVWAASVAISVLAVGKIALLQLTPSNSQPPTPPAGREAEQRKTEAKAGAKSTDAPAQTGPSSTAP